MGNNLSRRDWLKAITVGCTGGLAGCGGGGSTLTTPPNPDPEISTPTPTENNSSSKFDGGTETAKETGGGEIDWGILRPAELTPTEDVPTDSPITDDGTVQFTLELRNTGDKTTTLRNYDWSVEINDSSGFDVTIGDPIIVPSSSETPPGETAEVDFSSSVSDSSDIASIQIGIGCPSAAFSDTNAAYC